MKWVISVLFSAAVLSGCGSSNKSNSNEANKTITPVAVHSIQPQEVAQYISNYKAQKSALSLQLEGKETPFSFIDTDDEQNLLIVQFEQGALLIGFDSDKQTPLPNLRFYQGNSGNINQLLENPNSVLQGSEITISSQNENYIYEGSLVSTEPQQNLSVRLVLNESLLSGGNSQVEIKDEQAFVSGTLGSNFYLQLSELIAQQPNVTTIVLQNVDGSVNDDINVHSGRLIRDAKLTTLMPADGQAYSGGVDIFAAGYKRVYQNGGKLGVHSWCCEAGKDAGQLGKDQKAHGMQLTYFREMLGQELGPEFYFFTIDAAPFDGIHTMTEAEITKYLLQD